MPRRYNAKKNKSAFCETIEKRKKETQYFSITTLTTLSETEIKIGKKLTLKFPPHRKLPQTTFSNLEVQEQALEQYEWRKKQDQ